MLKTNAKYEFADGFFKMKQSGAPGKWVYLDIQEDSVIVYDVQHRGNKHVVDAGNASRQVLTLDGAGTPLRDVMFRQRSLDLDFLTIPLKYRPSVSGFPHQLNANLNGGVYLGYRNDVYHLDYDQTPLGRQQRRTTHLGFSFGGFAGLGATAMNPWVTGERIAMDYDGVILTQGVAGIIGINSVTVGLAIGFDHLLDKNRRFWIYQQQPWVGLAFGLNLN